MKNLLIVLILFAGCDVFAQGVARTVSSNTYGAIAVDLNDYRIYGLSSDSKNQSEAEKLAIKACKKNGGTCSTILSFSGEGCALLMYSPSNPKIGVWVVAKTKFEAEEMAQAKIEKENTNSDELKSTWACNARFTEPLKVIILKEN